MFVDALDHLSTDIDAIQAGVGEVSEVALGDVLARLRIAIDRLESASALALLRFDRAREYGADGAVSPVAWLRWKCRLSPAAATERVALARQLPELPETDTALARGEIGYQHAALISRTARQIGTEAVRESECILIQSAKDLDPHHFAFVTRHLRHCADPDGALADANQEHGYRYVNLSHSFDGVYYLDGRLDTEGGATLQAALDALSRPSTDDLRSAGQRRADALVELGRQQMDSGRLPEVGGQRPHLTLTASVATLAALQYHPAADLEWGMPVPSETARRLACDADLTPILVDEQGRPLHVGRTTRTHSAAQRRALNVRDGGCRFPGCDRPVAWTDAHHLRHWIDGGETKLSNLILLCRRHHRMVHEEGWRLKLNAEGDVFAIPPERLGGRHYAARAGPMLA